MKMGRGPRFLSGYNEHHKSMKDSVPDPENPGEGLNSG